MRGCRSLDGRTAWRQRDTRIGEGERRGGLRDSARRRRTSGRREGASGCGNEQQRWGRRNADQQQLDIDHLDEQQQPRLPDAEHDQLLIKLVELVHHLLQHSLGTGPPHPHGARQHHGSRNLRCRRARGSPQGDADGLQLVRHGSRLHRHVPVRRGRLQRGRPWVIQCLDRRPRLPRHAGEGPLQRVLRLRRYRPGVGRDGSAHAEASRRGRAETRQHPPPIDASAD